MHCVQVAEHRSAAANPNRSWMNAQVAKIQQETSRSILSAAQPYAASRPSCQIPQVSAIQAQADHLLHVPPASTAPSLGAGPEPQWPLQAYTDSFNLESQQNVQQPMPANELPKYDVDAAALPDMSLPVGRQDSFSDFLVNVSDIQHEHMCKRHADSGLAGCRCFGWSVNMDDQLLAAVSNTHAWPPSVPSACVTEHP